MFTNLAILGASNCGDLPDLNIARSRFGGQLGHILPDTCPSQLSALSNDFFWGKFINMGIQPWMEIQLSVFFWLGKFNEVWNLWDLYQQWAYQKINEVQWIGLGENHHPKPWLLPSGN